MTPHTPYDAEGERRAAAVEVRVAELREGDEIWVDVLEQWMFLVGPEQGGYSEITLYMDDGPEDFLPLRFKRSELVQCVRQPSLAEQLLGERG